MTRPFGPQKHCPGAKLSIGPTCLTRPLRFADSLASSEHPQNVLGKNLSLMCRRQFEQPNLANFHALIDERTVGAEDELALRHFAGSLLQVLEEDDRGRFEIQVRQSLRRFDRPNMLFPV